MLPKRSTLLWRVIVTAFCTAVLASRISAANGGSGWERVARARADIAGSGFGQHPITALIQSIERPDRSEQDRVRGPDAQQNDGLRGRDDSSGAASRH